MINGLTHLPYYKQRICRSIYDRRIRPCMPYVDILLVIPVFFSSQVFHNTNILSWYQNMDLCIKILITPFIPNYIIEINVRIFGMPEMLDKYRTGTENLRSVPRECV